MPGPTSDQLALALGPYVNRKLFSDHFLSELLPAWPEFAGLDPAPLLNDRAEREVDAILADAYSLTAAQRVRVDSEYET